jgi:hypothetical protein
MKRVPLLLTALLLFSLGVLPMANIVTPGAGLPWWRETVIEWTEWSGITLFIAFLCGAIAPARVEEAAQRTRRWLLRRSVAQVSVFIGLLALSLSLYASWTLFRFMPAAGDEFVQLWQASIFRHGHLSARPEALTEFFNGAEAIERGNAWFSQFPAGGPALFAMGLWLHAAWLINPFCAAIASIAVYRFASRAFGDETGIVSGFLTATSPFVFMLAGSYMNHTSTLALLWMGLACVECWRRADDSRAAMRWGALAGFFIAAAATIRPYDAALFALPLGVLQLVDLRKARWKIGSLGAQLAAGLIPLLLLFLVNTATTGAPMTFGYDLLNGAEHRPGFHVTPAGFVHTPLRALYMASAYLMKLDVALLAGPIPALLLATLGLAFLWKATEWDSVMASVILLFVIGYALYWSESYFLGPRFLYVIAPALLIYVGRVPLELRKRIGNPRLRSGVVLLLPVAVLVTWFIPIRAKGLVGARQLMSVSAVQQPGVPIIRAVREARLTNALVFVPEGLHGRIAAHLRAIGMRPLLAEGFAGHYDACAILAALRKTDEMTAASREAKLAYVMSAMVNDPTVGTLAALSPSEQLSLSQTRPVPPECAADFHPGTAHLASVAELMPYQGFDGDGSLGGNIVFARDMGARDSLLRSRFGSRQWYRVRLAGTDSALTATVEPYR